MVQSKIDVISMNSMSVKVHADAAAALKKNDPQSIGISREGRNTKIHMVSASDRVAFIFHLSGGQCHDAPQGRLLLEDERLEKLLRQERIYMAMNRGYEDDMNDEK